MDQRGREALERAKARTTDAEIVELIHNIVDDKVLLVIDTVGSEIGVLHRDMDAAAAKQIAELRAQVSSLTKSVSRLRATIANIHKEPKLLANNVAGSMLAEDRARRESGVIALRSRS